MNNYPRVMIAGTHSGSGKTTLTCGLLMALHRRGWALSSFKVGPDYIDPLFHGKLLGRPGRNLDLFFFSERTLIALFEHHAKSSSLSIIEGVMGFYDGLHITSSDASSYQVAKVLRAPVILVVDAKGSALSALSTLDGFLNFKGDRQIGGVIFNRCSPVVYEGLKGLVLERYSGSVKPLGHLPSLDHLRFKSRHLGLVMAEEIDDLDKRLEALADEIEKRVDLEGILSLAQSAEAMEEIPLSLPTPEEPVRIGVARDEAFCFYYEDNLELLERMGAELLFFSPLRDRLPEDIHGLYLGGGYPELHKEELSSNHQVLLEIRTRLESGLPTIAECGGLMYLSESIQGVPMVGFFKGDVRDTGRLQRFGYLSLQGEKDSLIGKASEGIKAHGFHYWDLPDPGSDFLAKKPSGRSWREAYASDTLYAGFPHLHFYANPSVAQRFYQACIKEKNRHANL